jgi:hypothetical protein
MVSLDSCHRAASAAYSSFQIKKRSPRSHNPQRIKEKLKDVIFLLKLYFSYSCVLSGVPDALHRGEISRFGEDTVLAKPLQQRGVQSGLRFPVAAADAGRTVLLPPEVAGRAARAAAAVPWLRRSAAGGHIFARVQKDLEQEKNPVVTNFSDMTKIT